MNIYSIVLYLHIVGALLLFVAMGIEFVTVSRLRSAGTAEQVRDWLGVLDEKKLAENYKVVLFTTVTGVLDSAIDDKLIRENPCKAKTVRRPVGGSPQVVVWPEERVHAVRAGLAEQFSVVVPLGSGLGLRQGEILGLSPDDIDRDTTSQREQ